MLRTALLLILTGLSQSRSDVLSGMGEFWFLNPGLTITKAGPGFELSGGRFGLGASKAVLLGGLARYEPSGHRIEAGMEAGFAVFLLEMGLTFSDRGSGEFIAPNLSVPIPGAGQTGMVVNLFYRIYPETEKENTIGGSLKFSWMR